MGSVGFKKRGSVRQEVEGEDRRGGAQVSEVNGWVASSTHTGRHTGVGGCRPREGRDDKLGLGTPGCAVTTGSQDTGLDGIPSEPLSHRSKGASCLHNQAPGLPM